MGDDVGHQALVTGRVFPHGDDVFAYLGVLTQHRLDFAELDTEYEALKASWGGFKGYDRWLGPENANNASLASIAVYTYLVPAFQVLLERSGGHLPAFYDEARRLAEMPQAQRHAMLNVLRKHAERTAAVPRFGAQDGEPLAR